MSLSVQLCWTDNVKEIERNRKTNLANLENISVKNQIASILNDAWADLHFFNGKKINGLILQIQSGNG